MSTDLSLIPATYLPTYLPTYIPTYLPTKPTYLLPKSTYLLRKPQRLTLLLYLSPYAELPLYLWRPIWPFNYVPSTPPPTHTPIYLTFVCACTVSIIVIDDNNMQLFGLFLYSQSALHVSCDVFAHHQEHLTVFTASDIVHRYCCRMVSWMRWACSSNSPMTTAGSNISGQNQKL